LLLLVIMERILEKTRYSDAELNEFKILIQHKLQIAREELGELLGALNSSNSNGDENNIAGKTLEDGSATYEKEPLGLYLSL